MLIIQSCQIQQSLGSFARACKPPFVSRVCAFIEKTTPLNFPRHFPELYSTVSVFKTPPPFPHPSPAGVASIFPMILASKDIFLNHFHMRQYFLLGLLSLLSLQFETEELAAQSVGTDGRRDGCLICLDCTWPLFRACTK